MTHVGDSIELKRKRWRERQRVYRAKRLAENPRYLQKTNLWQKYGLALERWDEMFADQGGKCAICTEAGELVVDHNHQTGQVRALLCVKCNLGIGCFVDNPELLVSAARYAEQWKS